MIEQSTPYRNQLGFPPAVDGKKANVNSTEEWTEQALAAYRRCYASAGNQESGDPGGRLAPRFECGEAIVRILKKKIPPQQPGICAWLFGNDPYRGQRWELARLEKAMSGPRGIVISPIVFSLWQLTRPVFISPGSLHCIAGSFARMVVSKSHWRKPEAEYNRLPLVTGEDANARRYPST
jgi:hypothetical protein